MRNWQRLAAIHAPALAVIAAVAAASLLTGITPARFTQDPAALTGAHPLLGAASNLGVLAWTATAAVCLFTAMLLHGRRDRREFARWMLAAGLLTCLLALDDLFLLHESLLPEALGIPQPAVLAAYVAAVGLFLLRFRAPMERTDRTLLGLALAFFAASVAADQLPGAWFRASGWLYLLEDGCKLLGIAGWSGYFLSVAASALRPAT